MAGSVFCFVVQLKKKEKFDRFLTPRVVVDCFSLYLLLVAGFCNIHTAVCLILFSVVVSYASILAWLNVLVFDVVLRGVHRCSESDVFHSLEFLISRVTLAEA